MYKIKLFITTLLLLAVFNFNATAQNAGDIDPTFNPTDVGFGNGDGADNVVYTTTLQPDGKIIIGGSFTTYNKTARNRIARLNQDGTLDSSFNPGTGVNVSVQTCTLQPDGKIIIGGGFTTYNGISINRIARLNTDGTLDTGFNSGTGVGNTVEAITLQPDGKIIIGGSFATYNGISSNRIARLNADGTLDSSFNSGTGANNTIFSSAIQPDGKIIIGGGFTTYNGISINRIARLNIDGTLDTTFNVGIGVNDYVQTCTLQPDGKIIIGGFFTNYNGTARYNIARLNADGTLDTSFNPGSGVSIITSNRINICVVQPDGKFIIGGNFSSYNGIARNNIARLNVDGTIDTSFNQGLGANKDLLSIALDPNGKIIIGGIFTSENWTFKNRIARLNADGTLDSSFNPGTGVSETIQTYAHQPDGKIIIGGGFTSYNGISRNKIARLNIDGTLDTTFNPGSGLNNQFLNSGNYYDCNIYTCALQPDGKIIIGGTFTIYNGTTRNSIIRLNADGILDTSFNTGLFTSEYVVECALQPDGKIIISYNGTGYFRIKRLNSDGSFDTSFNVGIGANYVMSSLALQPDGKIIIGGGFTTYNGISINRIARLNIDGTLDTTFNVGLGANNDIGSLALQPDGKIIIGGNFSSYNGTSRRRIARINTDGTSDTSFNPGTGADNWISTIALQFDGKVIIGGGFSSYNGTTRKKIARLNANGTLDAGFNPGTGAENTIYSSTIQPDGKIIIGGIFTSYNGIGRNRIARLFDCDVSVGTDVQTTCNPFTWIDGNTYTASTNTPTFTLTNSVGCDSVVTLNLTINNLIASCSIVDNSNGNYTFTNTSTGNFNQTHWAFGDGTTSTAANPSHTFSANGTYVLVLTVNDSTNGSCTDYYLDTIVVTGVVAPLQCAAGFVMYPDTTINNVIVVNSSTGSNLSYLWDFGDGNTSNTQFPTHTYATTDNYYLCLTIDDGAGCVDMYCDSIGQNGVVFNKQTGFTINVIAPPLATQINEQTSITNGLTIYPNPSIGIFTIEHSKENIPFIITDISGRVITIGKLTGNKTNIDLSKVQKGVYLLKIGEQTTKLIRQ